MVAVVKKYLGFLKRNAKSLVLMAFFISFSSLAVWLDDLERDINGVKPGVTMGGQQVERLLPAEVHQVVMELAMQYHSYPLEPRIDKATGKIIAEQSGNLLDVVNCQQLIMKAPPGAQLELPLLPISPKHSSLELAAISQAVGHYETWVSGSVHRHNNIALAARGISNVLLWPGEHFSFNEVVGPRSPERGYMPAPILLNGGRGMDFGGGVCQVASTLYNAALDAGLKIEERHAHSKAVRYVPEGRDATVSYPDLDLCFINNKDGPVIIKAGLGGSHLWVKIMGRSK